MGILCGHCGDRHATVAEVRHCSATPGAAAPLFGGFGGDDDPGPADPGPTRAVEPGAGARVPSTDREHTPPSRRRSTAAPTAGAGAGAAAALPASVSLEALVGPDALGRSVIVGPGQAAPPPWADCPRVTVTARPTDAVVDELHDAWSGRRRLVIEVVDEPDPTPVLDVRWWELSPDVEIGHERLAHLVFANAVDAREPGALRFAPLAQALAAGAELRATSSGDIALGDIALGDGGAWCDGGPLDDLGGLEAAVVPWANLAVGSLAPLGGVHGDRAGVLELAPDQLAAVTHRGGGARIIAPAGSGKTRVLTERARHLIEDLGIDPRAVCLIAFNVRAREEMQERTADLAGLEIRTLNSLALAICNGSGPFATPTRHRRVQVITEPEVRRMLDRLVSVKRQAMSDPIAAWIEALTASRLGLRDPKGVEDDFGGDVRDFATLGPRFVERLDDAGVVDFDQQILRAIEILLTDPAARAQARRVCAMLLVDEFQDLTPAHIVLVRLLAGPRADVFGVGDDDQTIYGYSGASPRWLIDFADLFPGAGRHDLEVNYRCPPAVVEAASTLLSHNRRRVTKVIHPAPGRSDDPGSDGAGPIVALTTSHPATALVERVQTLLAAGVKPTDIAVLTRVNATLLAPLVALDEAGVPCSKPVDVGFMERTGVSAALAWLALATAPAKALPESALGVAARRPPRAIAPRVVDWISEKRTTREIADLGSRMRDERDAKKLDALVADIETVRRLADHGASTRRLLEAIRDDVGLGGALDRRLDASKRSVDRSSHGDDLAALLSIADLHTDPAGFADWLAERLRSVDDDRRGVRLATVHKVKGREWPHVVVYEATAGLVPHRLADAIEEERRIFHVAITRCSSSVTVISGQPPSPFVDQMTVARDPSAPEPPPLKADGARARNGAGAAPKPRRSPPPAASSIEVARRREQLRTWRAERSKRDGVPAYVVFSDATLVELAEYRPSSADELLSISGIGPTKVDRYGAELLAVLAD
jgi:DNA helicase-2/ATP-dependent DNA helicase PcrA